MSALAETLRSLDRGFSELGVRWYVFGAQAAILHGAARATADIDVTVDLEVLVDESSGQINHVLYRSGASL